MDCNPGVATMDFPYNVAFLIAEFGVHKSQTNYACMAIFFCDKHDELKTFPMTTKML